jgi:hypothetical protein
MLNIHHKPIKRFSLKGIIYDDSAIVRLRNEYSRLLSLEMKISGYVPRLDIAEDFTIGYNEGKQYFEFKLTIYGVYVGKKKSEWVIGVDQTRVVATQKSKSSELSQEQASQ